MRTEVIGDATLILGDCRQWLERTPDCYTADCIVTSPPYGEIRDYGGHSTDILDVISMLARHLEIGGVMMWNVADQVVNGSETGESFRQALHAMSCGLRLHDTMIYCKNGVTFPDSNRYHPCFEYMFVFSKGAPSHFNGIRDMTNKWRGTMAHGSGRIQDGSTVSKQSLGMSRNEIPNEGLRRNWWVIANQSRDENEHPAKMPLSMAADHIRTWTQPGDIVFDPFMGSGTTGVASLDFGRRFVGLEIHEPYFDIACRRLEAAYRQPRLFGEPEAVQDAML